MVFPEKAHPFTGSELRKRARFTPLLSPASPTICPMLSTFSTTSAARALLAGDELTGSEREELVRLLELLEELASLHRESSRETRRVGEHVKAAERVGGAELLELARAGKPAHFPTLGAGARKLREELAELEESLVLVAHAVRLADAELGELLRRVWDRRHPAVKGGGKVAEKLTGKARKVAGGVGLSSSQLAG